MAKVYATPGVYIEEKSAFANSAVAVATAVPAFVGYTEKAIAGKRDLSGVPTRISSYGDFLNYFGGASKTTFEVTPGEAGTTDYSLKVTAGMYYLHANMRMFFANGGSDCYIVSVGQYGKEAAKIDKAQLIKGIDALKKEPEPTMLVLPDAMLLEEQEAFDVQGKMLSHCGSDMRSRVAILDVFRGFLDRSPENDPDPITNFREKIGQNFLQWGAAYYPWIESTAVQGDEVDITNISNPDGLKATLTNEVNLGIALGILSEKRAADINKVLEDLDKIAPAAGGEGGEEGGEGGEAAEGAVNINNLHQTLLAISPTYKDILKTIRETLNRVPPSATMAGVYSMVDNNVGVFQSPANVSVGSVVKPSINITSEDQEDLNLPLNGKAVNAIRTFPGKGVLVWGARTLDGNSGDWRYISVRRTMIMLEQSIKAASEAYVFSPNTSATWSLLSSMIGNFLTNAWKQGALAGSTPEEAFSVAVGLGSTMTSQDILDGIMNITVKVAITRPAEFIVITFQQQMQQS